MRTILFSFVMILINLSCFSQISTDYYLIEFTDKNGSPYSVDQPTDYLSQKSVERRIKYNIPIAERDFPVNPSYVIEVKNIGVKIVQQVKWFNAIVIKTSDNSKLDLIAALPFVKKVVKNRQFPGKTEEPVSPLSGRDIIEQEVSSIDYGQAFSQISMVGGVALHNLGFLGQGLSIAVLDGGFSGANFMTAFDSLRINGQIKGTLNLVGGGTYVYQGTSHGSNVLSVLAANLPGVMVGTAPKADYYLIRSEDTNGESLLEEYNWVSGAEYADSAGADIITTSLNYILPSNPSIPLTFEQLDGNTAPITIGAEIASNTGMIVVASAGNNGENQSWPHIGFPADGDSVFTVGAVDAHGIRASFSSPGPTYDGRIKPDVMAMGSGTTIMKSDGTLGSGDGTSFSTPIIAGLTACLWQSYPEMSNMDILRAIRKSCTQFTNPDNMMGYGIPDFSEAINHLSATYRPEILNTISFAPNPFTNELTIYNIHESISLIDVELIDLNSKIVFCRKNIAVSAGTCAPIVGLSFISRGFYLLRITSDKGLFTNKIVKINN